MPTFFKNLRIDMFSASSSIASSTGIGSKRLFYLFCLIAPMKIRRGPPQVDKLRYPF
jgi:hypothetical protein